MPELDRFDTRLEAGVQAFADRARTSVDAAAVAAGAMRHRRAGPSSWLGVAVPVPVSMLVVLVLLVLALALSLGVGAGRNHQLLVAPGPTATPTASPADGAASATPNASATLDPATDGQADEVITGSLALALTTPYTETREGAVTHLRDGVITVTALMSDPRVSGSGTWRVSADRYSGSGPRWGPHRVENSGGAWEGTCSGTASYSGGDAAWSCWLIGSGAYAGYSYFYSASGSDQEPGDVRGVIVPCPPPNP